MNLVERDTRISFFDRSGDMFFAASGSLEFALAFDEVLSAFKDFCGGKLLDIGTEIGPDYAAIAPAPAPAEKAVARFSPEQHRRVVQNLLMADSDIMIVNEETSPVWLTPQSAAQAWECGEMPARLSDDGRAQVYAGALGYVTLVDVMVDRFVYQFGI